MDDEQIVQLRAYADETLSKNPDALFAAVLANLVERGARHVLSSAMAAALADPDVDEVAKSLAGYVLQWLEGQGE